MTVDKDTPKIKSKKWYAWFWLPERRKIKLMQAIFDHMYPEMKPKIDKAVNKALKDYLIYGVEPKYTSYKKGKL